jgi:CRISPR-associated endonuclease Cas1
MFTRKDIEMRSIFVVNCINHSRSLRVLDGELMLEEVTDDGNQTLTKFPFQKLLALFIIGHITVTTPLIEKCKKYNVALVVLKPNLRPVFYWSNSAEANYLLRQYQYALPINDISIAKTIVYNKIYNQIVNLKRTKKKDCITVEAIENCQTILNGIDNIEDYKQLMGNEGIAAKSYFAAYFQSLSWRGRYPRTKCDSLNVTLDIGYTILFNYIECFVRMFGFDIYKGVYHRQWFQRKSLICDLIEPFRCLIDHAVLLAFNRKQFKETDFILKNSEYQLKKEKVADYYRIFYDVLIEHKSEVFKYVQAYYRCFMGRKSVKTYPQFSLK